MNVRLGRDQLVAFSSPLWLWMASNREDTSAILVHGSYSSDSTHQTLCAEPDRTQTPLPCFGAGSMKLS
jgi:hypothetical protein